MKVKQALQSNSKLNLGTALASGDLELFDISVETESYAVSKALKDAGLSYTQKSIQKKLDLTAAKALNQLTKIALSAARSTVPVRSGALRNQNIIISGTYFRSSQNTKSRKIVVTGTHNSPYKSQLSSAAAIAVALDTRGYMRWNDSKAEAGFTAYPEGTQTRDWISNAQKQFRANKRTFLSQVI